MGGQWAFLRGFLLGGAFALAVGSACAEGGRFGGGGFPGFHFGGPRFDGPRFDGPRFDGPRFEGPRYEGRRFDGPRPHEPAEREPAEREPAEREPRPRESISREPLDDPPPARRPPGPPPQDAAAPPASAGGRRCLSPAESRARVEELNLRPPFEMMRRAATLADAQALGGKLCRWGDRDIYDISLLRPDGRVVHVFFDASTGHEVGAPKMH